MLVAHSRVRVAVVVCLCVPFTLGRRAGPLAFVVLVEG